MGKTREIACSFYNYEGDCQKGHKGTFNKCCQFCKDYRAKRGSMPRRQDLRKKKKERWQKKEREEY